MTPELLLWYLQFAASLLGRSIVPVLWVMAREWPFHWLCGASLGLLAYSLTGCTFPASLNGGTGWRDYLYRFNLHTSRAFAGLAVLCVTHWLMDYSGQTIIPAGVG